MSHFTVLVKVKKDRLENHDGDLQSALREMLLPYNANAKWDWYQIGGRWSGMLPVKAGAKGRGERANEGQPDLPETADFCQVKDLNITKMEQNVLKEIDNFWVDYQMWLEIKDMSYQEIIAKWGIDDKRHYLKFCLHDRLIEMGVGVCTKPRAAMVDAKGNPIMEDDQILTFLCKEKRQRQKWSDPVFQYKDLKKQELYDEYHWYFEFSTFAVLDDDGWKEKGKMGLRERYWGFSSDSIEDRKAWSKSYFQTFIAHEDPETTLVVVDCHM